MPNDIPAPESPLFDAFPPVATEDWNARIRKDMGTDDVESLVWDSLDGFRLRPYYRAEDLADFSHVSDESASSPLAASDDTPANAWRIRQDLAHASPDDLCRALDAAQAADVTDIGLQMAVRDGRLVGPALQTRDDWRRVLDALAPSTRLHLPGGPLGLAAWTMVRSATPQAPPLVVLNYAPTAALVTGTLTRPQQAYDYAAQLVRAETRPAHPLAIDATPYHRAGAAMVDEMACTLAAFSELLAQETERGLALNDLLAAIHFVVPVGTSFFPALAKLRALRLLLPQVAAGFLDAAAADASYDANSVRLHAHTAWRSRTVYDPHMNLLRGTTAATAAALGGADVISVAPFDAAGGAPNAFADRLARNTQLILKHEAHLNHVADPAAGSYYIEALTDQLARTAWSRFQAIEGAGGILEALRDGALHERIRSVGQQRLAEVARRTRILVGTNHYPNPAERRTADVDARPSGTPVAADAPAEAPLAPDAPATLADRWAGLQDDAESFLDPLPAQRLSAAVEACRLRTERAPRTPVVFLLPVGPRRMRSARATFARNFFGVAGFEIVENVGFASVAEGADAAAADADLIVLCSSDEAYADAMPALRDALGKQPPLVYIAGAPASIDATADGFIHRHAPLLDTLTTAQDRLGLA
ncbi:methylmalonyl-CoA mutase family protein [Salisaeta longa]|uniref:methylmalonyl-CoA mutase family protein n=1 Tax=Salisaeta longa TaxID=503170 RepID=UPI0003B39D05|nr:methylmalonyl-CoA mutase family protein [Salisaeta longa]